MASILAGLPAARQPRLASESALRSLPPSPASCSYQLRSTGRFARRVAAQADSFNRLYRQHVPVAPRACALRAARQACAARSSGLMRCSGVRLAGASVARVTHLQTAAEGVG